MSEIERTKKLLFSEDVDIDVKDTGMKTQCLIKHLHNTVK